MAKQLNVNLGFTADVGSAKAQINNLQSELTKLTRTPVSLLGGKPEQEINQAIKGVIELQQHLKSATNINTGSLDFSKLNESIKKSGTNLQDYGNKLRSLGPAGQNAFNQLAQAVTQSEIPIRRSNALLTEFATTLKNTARWQLSSSILHGFMGGLQSAVGYAKDLNRSLNDIRIVTGYNIDQMTEFAERANKAAKALSTTTTDYTKASLIYFQQGLSDTEVKQRTDITIKMANVSRQSAEIVSDQMTAVWNNFADGSQTLESFADAMVALGAATASSSDEIAGGLEKFAAIGQTIGLSFEYASAALATITAKTRQSEEVVGTALKTIFARIQGLKVGKTLEDGTDLNKYSQALDTYGIKIKDAAGNLKDMDDILDEMGRKWKTLAKDEQAALAQTVAGVRQYNQLISLMDNWDFMKENLDTIKNSSGALNDQAEIYEESWEAASDRVRASMEGIFNDLIDDKAFISILNTFENILSYIDNLIEGLGGLRGVLITLAAVVTKVFSNQIAQGLTSMTNSIYLMTKSGQKSAQNEKAKAIKGFGDALGTADYTSEEDKVRNKYLKDNLTLQQSFIDNEQHMSDFEKEINKALLDRNKILSDNAINAAKSVDVTAEERSNAKFRIQTEIAQFTGNDDIEAFRFEKKEFQQTATELESIIIQQEAVKNSMKILGDESLETSQKISKITDELKESGEISPEEIEKIEKELEESGADADVLIKKLGELQNQEIRKKTEMVYGRGQANTETMDGYEALTGKASETNVDAGTGISKKATEAYTTAIRNNIVAKREAKQANKDLEVSEKAVKQSIEDSKGAQKRWADTLVSAANGITSLFSAINMIKGAYDVLKNPDTSGWEKFLSIASSLAMTIPILIHGFTGLKTIWQGIKVITQADTVAKGLNAAATWLQIIAEKKLRQVKGDSGDTIKDDTKRTNQDTNIKVKKIVKNKVSKNSKPVRSPSTLGGKTPVGKVTGNVPKGTSLIGGFKGLKTAALNLTKTLGSVAKAFGPIVIGAALAAAAISTAISIYNKDATAAKEAAERAKQAQEEFDKAHTAYQEFSNKINSYKEGQDGLSQLTKGTIEYREEMLKANDAALDLIRTYGLMADEYEVIDGHIKITEEGLNRIKKQELEKLEMAQAYSTTLNQQAKTAQVRADQTKFNREYAKGSGWSSEDTAWMTGAVGAGTGIGMIAGSFIPGLGNIVGAAVGAAVGLAVGGIVGGIGAIFGKDSEKEEDKALRILQEAYDKKGNSIFLEGGIRAELEGKVSEKLIASLEDNSKETQEMVEALSANTAAIEASIVATAGTANVYNSEYQKLSDEDKELADKIIGDKMAKVIANPESEEYKKARKEVEKLFDWGDQDAYDEYLKARYGDEASNYKVVDQSGTHATLKKKNADGTWETVGDKESLTNEEVIKFLTEMKLQSFSNKEVTTALNSIGALGEKLKTIENIDSDAITEIKSQLASGDMVDLTLMSPEQISDLKSAVRSMGSTISREHINAINEAISNYDVRAYEARMKKEADRIIEQGAKELDTTTGALEAYTEQLMRSNETYAENKKLAAQTAVETFKFSKALEKLEEVVKDNIKNIKNFNANNLECYESIGAVRNALKETFDLEVDTDFIVKNIDLISKASKGSEEAVEKLGVAMSKNFIENLAIAEENIDAFYNTTLKSTEGLTIGNQVYKSLEEFTNNFNTAKQNVLGYIDEIYNANLGIGDSLSQALGPDDMANFIGSLNEMAAATNMSVESMQSMLSSMGVQAKVEQTWVPGKIKVPIYETREDVQFAESFFSGERVVRTSTRQVGEKEMDGGQYVASISYDGTKPSTNVTFSGGKQTLTTPSTGKKSGGGSSSSKSKQKKTRSDEFDRYYYETSAIDKYTKALDKASKKKDQLWGPARAKAMQDEIKAYSTLIENQKDYIKAISGEDGIGGFLQQDRKELAKYGGQFDSEGNLLNYYEMTDKWLSDYNNAVSVYNNSDKDEDADKAFEAAEKLFKKRKEAFEQWKKTKELNEEEKAKLEEYINTRREAVYDDIIYKVEFKIEVDDTELKVLDYYLSKIEDDFYKSAEAFAKSEEKLNVYANEERFKAFENEKKELDEAYQLYLQDPTAEGAIDQAMYQEGLKKLLDNTIDTATSIQDIQRELGEYYQNVLSTGAEKMSEYGEQFDTFLSTLDHYESILTLLGRDKNHKEINNLLENRLSILNDSLEVSKANLAYYEEQEQYWKQQVEQAANEEQKKLYENNLKAVTEYKKEEQEKIYGYLEEIGEVALKKLENNLEESKKNIEKAMTGGSSFDSIMTSFERLDTYQEDYLTTTNKIYETNKLISKSERDIEKTSNKAAKQKYNEYIKYIKQLQENEKLSKYDLEIAQKRYEVLQAQIALEEAKDAKTTVRLQRDSEGNFGYIYTADTEKTADAEQELLDKQNELYNISLETSNDYIKKYWQTLQEGTDAMHELWVKYYVDHSITEEEYNEESARLQEYYQNQAESYLDLSQKARLDLTEDHYSGMKSKDDLYYGGLNTTLDSTEKFINSKLLSDKDSGKAHLEKFAQVTSEEFTKCKGYAETWKEETLPLVGQVGSSYFITAGKIKIVTDKSKELVDKYTDPKDGVLKTITDTITEVGNLTTAWSSQWSTLDTTKLKYDGLIGSISEALRLASIEVPKTIEEEQIEEEVIQEEEIESESVVSEGEDTKYLEVQEEENKEEGISLKSNGYSTSYKIQDIGLDKDNRRIVKVNDKWYDSYGVNGGRGQKGQTATFVNQDFYENSSASPPPPAFNTDDELKLQESFGFIQGYMKNENGEMVEDSPALNLWGSYGSLGSPIEIYYYNGQYYYRTEEQPYMWFKGLQLKKYDTGGYTGEWGPEGRMAMLHEKELVLNKQDTENFLTATQILREISDMLDHNALVASLGAINLRAMTVNNAADQLLQQEVTIHADFPNVTDHNEIEMAIDNLINAASQHAFKS